MNTATGEFQLSISFQADSSEEKTKPTGKTRRFGGSSVKSRSPSIKFSANNFVTQSCDSFDQHYKILNLLGEGAYGEVYVCRHRESGADRAVKILQVTTEEEMDVVLSEFQILRGIDHPNLLKIYQLYEQEEEGSTEFYIVSDLYQGGELYDELEQLGYFPEDDAAVIMNQVLSCINYCHSNGICHRDLKPENILLADSDNPYADLKIIDFGLAEVFDDYDKVQFTDRVGSSYYIAPEVFDSPGYGPKCDIWSCGVICFILLCGEAPFDGDSDEEIIQSILDGEFTFDSELWADVSQEAKDFCSWLLTLDEHCRPTAEEALQHSWLKNTRRSTSLDLQRQDSTEATDYLANLEHFRADSKLKQAVCAFISSQLILKHEKDVIDELFRAMDINCDGKLSREELQKGYADFLGRQLSDQEVEDIFQNVNYSCSGALTYSEFLVASITLDETRLQATFNEFDQGGSGVLTAEDLMVALDLNGDNVEEYVTKIVNQVAPDHNGVITLEDFISAMANTAPQYRFSTTSRRSTLSSRPMSDDSSYHSRRSTLRRSTQIVFEHDNLQELLSSFSEEEQQSVKDTKKSSGVNDVLKSWHSAIQTPRKIRTARSNALPHAMCTGYAKRPSRVSSRLPTRVLSRAAGVAAQPV